MAGESNDFYLRRIWLLRQCYYLKNEVCICNILNKSKNATPELFAIYIQNYANQECIWKCILMFKYWVMHNSKRFTDDVTRIYMKAI